MELRAPPAAQTTSLHFVPWLVAHGLHTRARPNCTLDDKQLVLKCCVRTGLLMHPTLLQEAVKDTRCVPHAALHSLATSACTQGPANIPSKWHKLTFERGQFVRA